MVNNDNSLNNNIYNDNISSIENCEGLSDNNIKNIIGKNVDKYKEIFGKLMKEIVEEIMPKAYLFHPHYEPDEKGNSKNSYLIQMENGMNQELKDRIFQKMKEVFQPEQPKKENFFIKDLTNPDELGVQREKINLTNDNENHRNLPNEPKINPKKRRNINENDSPNKIRKIDIDIDNPNSVNFIVQSNSKINDFTEEVELIQNDNGDLIDHLFLSPSTDKKHFNDVYMPKDLIGRLKEILSIQDLNKKQQFFKDWKTIFSAFNPRKESVTIEKIFEMLECDKTERRDKTVQEVILFCLEETFINTMNDDKILKSKRQMPQYIEQNCAFLLNTPNFESIVNKWLSYNFQSRIYQAINNFLQSNPTHYKHKNHEKFSSWIATLTLHTYLSYSFQIYTQSSLNSQVVPDNIVTLTAIEELKKNQKKEHAEWLKLIQSKRNDLISNKK